MLGIQLTGRPTDRGERGTIHGLSKLSPDFHVEADECGALNEWFAVAPQAAPLCGTVAAMVASNDLADRPPRALADGESVSLGKHAMRWFDAPHLPHAWECGFIMEGRTRPLLCGDPFTQGGSDNPAITESDILGPSEAFRHQMDYFSHTKNARQMLERLAATDPTTLACMHGSAWRETAEAPSRPCGCDLYVNDAQQPVPELGL